MHVRGSSLSQPKVVEALRPYVVAFWGQSSNEPVPEDLRPLYAASPRGHSNVRCFVLDPEGRLVHSFDGIPGPGVPTGYSAEQYAAYYTREIARAGIEAAPREAPLRLPDVQDGVRLFVRLPEQPGSYAYPVVETVADQGEWATLAYPKAEREIDAGKLFRWLRLCYPPGVNEQLQPFRLAHGTLTLRPIGPDRAVLAGIVRLGLSERDHYRFEGTFQAVMTYGPQVTLRGVVDGTYWRRVPRQERWTAWKLTAAIESRPK